jgi:ubiquinone/menaquinone biosynthesis C-methylase UbiE
MNRKERRAAAKRRGEPARMASAATLYPVDASLADLTAKASRLHQLGQIGEAQEICRQILARDPSHVQSLNLLGVMAQASGDHQAAVKMLARALASDELNAACHYNVGNSYQALGRRPEAIVHFKKALALGMDEKAAVFILQSPVIASCVARIAERWPLPLQTAELFGPKGVAALADDLFLRCAMEVTTLQSVALESLLGYSRAELLRLASGQVADAGEINEDMVAFACALAQQCFINEYIYVQTREETDLSTMLRDQLLQNLASGAVITVLTLAVVGAYFPLHTMPVAQALLHRDWPAVAAGLLQRQLREPLEEVRDRDSIATLTPVKDSLSRKVRHQYEENPYPRWTINPLAAFAVDQARGRTVPTAERQADLEILIAGCGTGLHAVQVAQIYPNARLLAVDISRTSLAYAQRKTRELGLRNIEYAQADILKLGAIGRAFDRIESVGVLVTFAEPEIGWRVLISLLRPGGKMRIGLYSEAARRVIAEARAHIAERGYRAAAEDIRKCRQDIIREAQRWKMLIGSRDFYSMSGCRDLMFNVVESCHTIPEIAAFLQDNDLSFLGFEFSEDPSVIERFQKQFQDPDALTNLDHWHAFEADHPETFWGMYLFTLRKDER